MDLPRFLQLALQELESGAADKCFGICNEILAENPGLIQALFLRGCAAYQIGDLDRSVSDLDTVHGNHPEHLHAAYYLGRSLRAAGKAEEALAPLRLALGEKQFEVLARYELAVCLTRLRQRPEAIELYQSILDVQPNNVQVAANLATVLERENRLDEAESWTAKALAMDATNETARMTRTTLDRRSGKYPEAAQGLRRLIPETSSFTNRSIAWNNLGQCLEGQEEWDEAFDAFSESNRILKESHTGSRPDERGPHGMQTLARIHDWLQGTPVKNWNRPSTNDAGGIAFLVGFPRSGTTLLDRMLGSHPQVEVLEEKSLFSSLHQDWAEPGTLEAIANLSDAQITDGRNRYRQEMSRHRRLPERSLVIDKLPLNLAYLFMINRLFPDAPVIFLQRHPMDACISCYFQAFELKGSMGYFLDIQQTARYYDAVMQVAVSSMKQIDNPVHQLRYEDLVKKPQDQLALLFDFLDLEKHDSTLDYRHQGGGEASDTPSYQQVTQPLHTRSIGRWRNFSSQMESSLSILRPWVEQFGYQESDTST